MPRYRTRETLVFAAATAVALPEVNPLEVEGDIIAAGSSTVYPLAERMAERAAAHPYGGATPPPEHGYYVRLLTG